MTSRMDIDNHNNKKRKFSDDSIHERPCPELQQNNDPMDVEQSQEALRLEACECARRTHQELFENSSIPDRSRDYPKFARNEIRLGNMLGKGGFGTVYEVLGFDIDHQPQMKRTSSIRRLFGAKKTEPDAELLRGEMQSRKFIAKHCIRNGGDARYAVKQLSSNIVSNHIRLFQGIADLATETRIMSSLAHPNIMKLRAIAQGPSWFHPDYFIVMDRLYDTLQRRSLIVWKKRQNRSKGIVGKVTDYYGLKKAELYVDRIFAAFDLSSALHYLHQRRIMHRDVKPENVGFDIRGDIKIFDFGLAKEFPERTPDSPSLYNFTGMCGSPRYMAPEVALKQPYNETCDVYSFAIVFWEMLSFKVALGDHTMTTLQQHVWSDEKERPPTDKKWSHRLRLLLNSAWSSTIEERPSMSDIEDILHEEVLNLRDGDETGMSHSQRRSTFVLNRGDSSTISSRGPRRMSSGWSNSCG